MKLILQTVCTVCSASTWPEESATHYPRVYKVPNVATQNPYNLAKTRNKRQELPIDSTTVKKANVLLQAA